MIATRVTMPCPPTPFIIMLKFCFIVLNNLLFFRRDLPLRQEDELKSVLEVKKWLISALRLRRRINL
jgi:hypothetical protein